MKKGLHFEKRYDLDALIGALTATAADIGAECDPDLLRRTLEVFREPFESTGSAYRTTTRLPRAINLRYFELLVPHQPFDAAVEAGLIEPGSHPCTDVIPHAFQNLPMTGDSSGFGVDIGLGTGLEKIWIFFENWAPLDDVMKNPSLPPAVGKNLEYFSGHRLTPIKGLGVDFSNRSLNLYFMTWDLGGLDPDRVARLISDLGFAVPDEVVLAHCARALAVYHTVHWDSPDVERLCFACVAPVPQLVPRWFPVMEEFVAKARSLSERKVYFYNPTFTRSGDDYTKVEICYHASFADNLLRLVPEPFLKAWQSAPPPP
jgi:hypothetical protein